MTDEPATEGVDDLPEDTDKVDLEPLKGYDPELYQVMNRRVGTLYGTTKELRKTLDEMSRANKVLFEKVQGMEKRGAESERQQILDQIKTASEEGDHEKVATLTDRLTRLNSSSKDGSDPEPKAEDTAARSSTDGKGKEAPDPAEVMSSEDEARLAKWVNEKDSEGNPVRPWLQEGHPKYKRAMAAAQAVMADESLTPAQMMAEMDSIMGMQKPSPQAAVLTPGQPPRTGKSSKPKATPEQKAAAEAMGVKLDEYMAVVAQSETYPDGSMVKTLELED